MTRGSTIETLLNAALARLLRRHGLEAEAEQSLRGPDGRLHRVDVLVEMEDHAVAIEAEFESARTVIQDATKRLPDQELVWRGLPIRSAFAVAYPQFLRDRPESEAGDGLANCQAFRFCSVPRPINGGVAIRTFHEMAQGLPGEWHSGTVRMFSDCLHSYWVQTSGDPAVDKVVAEASRSIDFAAEYLRRRVPTPTSGEDSDPGATHALIWLNALLFQELLASHLDTTTLKPPHTGKKVPRPDPEGRPSVVTAQWEQILEINWWPIFAVALESLKPVPPYWARLALRRLQVAASRIAETGVIRRHDIAGRIFHRLLGARKFLATNYTTIPAAVLLAGLAFDPRHRRWKALKWDREEEVARLRIIDPACGSGTLLMAVLQEILKSHRRAGGGEDSRRSAIRSLLETALHGFDVVPAAVHLTAATLSMAETAQAISNMPIFWMPHDVDDGRARLGSLDFLLTSPGKGKAQFMQLFPDEHSDPSRISGTGERIHDAHMPERCDLFIANPPYTRAGGPGSAEYTDWNPLFGSVLSQADSKTMQTALKKTLGKTPASLYAGLGSAFAVLATERLGPGGRLAFVLPATAITGSRWAAIRKMLLENYEIDWIVVSHDTRNRPAKMNLPGRRFVAFSESTRIAETLIVATRVNGSPRASHSMRFVNLRRNPDEPIQAIGLVSALLSHDSKRLSDAGRELTVGGVLWGEVLRFQQSSLDTRPWPHVAFVQGRLTNIALALQTAGTLCIESKRIGIPIKPVNQFCDLGPYHMQIRNPRQGLFTIVETDDVTRSGYPALWHHSADRITTLSTDSNARLNRRQDRDPAKVDAMLARRGRLHIASELGHAPQRLAAVLTKVRALGVRSWITLLPKDPAPGKEEALCLWLNSTPGVLLRIAHSNRPYLGRSSLPLELIRTLPVLDVDALSTRRLEAAKRVFQELGGDELLGFAHIESDPVRRELDYRLFNEVLGHDIPDELVALAAMLNAEPTMTTRH